MTPELLAGLIGLAMPFLIQWLKGCDWPRQAKFGFSLAICLVVGGITAYVADPSVFTVETALVAGTATFTAAQIVYKTWLEGVVDRAGAGE